MHLITWPFFFLICKIFIKFKVYGTENLKKIKGPAIFVSNHKSYFDPFLIGAGIPLNCRNLYPVYYLAQDKLFQIRYLRPFLRIYGSFPGKIKQGTKEAIKKPLNLLNKNKTIGIFPQWCYKEIPEGKCIYNLIALISSKNKNPVIPIFIFGIHDDAITWKKIILRQKVINLIFGKPIYPLDNVSTEDFKKIIKESFVNTKISLIKILDEKEKKFWSKYANFYYFLERAEPYKKLIQVFNNTLPNKIQGRWLDLGSGSGSIVELLNEKKENEAEIWATDMDTVMLKLLMQRFKKDINIKTVDLSSTIDFPPNYFNGVTANLVLTYITHHEKEVGLKAFDDLLNNIYNILRPGGLFIWSTPKNNVKFQMVFLKSLKNVLDPRNLNHIYYGPAILQQALKIQEKGKRKIYHFLKPNEIETILKNIGFVEIKFTRSMANQVEIIKCKKPLIC